jgi:hypothetical protein
MRHVRIPSPALLVALIALFVSLGGGAYAALRVGSKEIVNNSVRSKDVRNGQLRGTDVRDRSLGRAEIALDALTGDQIDEAGLGRVPSAADAQALAGRRRVNVAHFSLTSGQAREVLREGPFTLTARCWIGVSTSGGPRDQAAVIISSAVDNAAFDAADSGALHTSTPEAQRNFVAATASPGAVAVDSLQDALAVAPDGTEEIGDASLYAMVNALGQPGTCRFGGWVDLG